MSLMRGYGMSDQGDFVEGALHHVWGASAEQHLPGMSMTVRDGDVGFLTFYSDEYVKWSSIVAEINKGLPVGVFDGEARRPNHVVLQGPASID
jgi:hypothetical protein